MAYFCVRNTAAGPVGIGANETAITALVFQCRCKSDPQMPPLIGRAFAELQEYFSGTRREFDLPLEYSGTSFQMAVWNALRTIPFGETATYGEIAAKINRPTAVRAVGGACHHNPIGIFIPCHRVVGASGKLTGFAGGLDVKSYLLNLEKITLC